MEANKAYFEEDHGWDSVEDMDKHTQRYVDKDLLPNR